MADNKPLIQSPAGSAVWLHGEINSPQFTVFVLRNMLGTREKQTMAEIRNLFPDTPYNESGNTFTFTTTSAADRPALVEKVLKQIAPIIDKALETRLASITTHDTGCRFPVDEKAISEAKDAFQKQVPYERPVYSRLREQTPDTDLSR